MGKPLKTSLLLMGASGIVGQVILLREMLVSFYGNELTIGIILANWLLLEAAGAVLGGRFAEKTAKKLEVYVLFQLIFAAAFPPAVFFSRIFKAVFFETPGEALGLVSVFAASFLLLLPVALPHGALFPFGCRLAADHQTEKASSIGNVYVLETLGSIAGGILLTYLLIQLLDSLTIAILISLANALISIVLLRVRKILFGAAAVMVVLMIPALSPPVLDRIHAFSLRLQWRGMDVVHSENSVYGNITVTRQGEQYTFFSDGLPAITAPDPDVEAVEDFVHFPFLHHPNPESAAVLGGGAGGIIREILKHPVRRVDYVELDPLVLKLLHRFETPTTRMELADPRVHVHFSDGRFHIKRTNNRYDIILIGLSAPQELQTNRLFTREFFLTARGKMNPGGLLALSLPGSATHITAPVRDLNRCIEDTLRSVFPHVRTIPGDINLFIASDSAETEKTAVAELAARMAEREIESGIFTDDYLAFRLRPERLAWFRESMEGAEPRLNSDFRPIGVFYSLATWNALFAPGLTKVFSAMGALKPASLFWPGFLIPVLLFLAFKIKPRLSTWAVPYAVLSSGLCGMIFQLSVILTFQSFFGYLYHQVGLLLTLFLAGTAFGGRKSARRPDRAGNGAGLFLKLEAGFVGLAVGLPFVFSGLALLLETGAGRGLPYAVFFLISFVSGFLVGFQFPLAAGIQLELPPEKRPFGQTAGLLYGADLLGGFLGGLAGGILLLPVLGLKAACFFLALVKIGSWLLILVFTKMRK
ncbi:MAG: spermine synthase [Acidobacteriota bacterium]|nr:spermine synthase [Acidobacteriota bacterium]